MIEILRPAKEELTSKGGPKPSLTIKDMLPPERSGKKGRPCIDNRKMLNGMHTDLWSVEIARSVAQWREMPARYGKWSGVYTRFSAWRNRGILETIFRRVQTGVKKGQNQGSRSLSRRTEQKIHAIVDGLLWATLWNFCYLPAKTMTPRTPSNFCQKWIWLVATS